jgi:hypothetical protein
MKKIIALFVSLFVVSSVAFAKPVESIGLSTMSKSDAQVLFTDGSNINVVALGSDEMKNTEGKGFLGFLIGTDAYLGWATYDYYTTNTWHGSWGGYATTLGAFSWIPW